MYLSFPTGGVVLFISIFIGTQLFDLGILGVPSALNLLTLRNTLLEHILFCVVAMIKIQNKESPYPN